MIKLTFVSELAMANTDADKFLVVYSLSSPSMYVKRVKSRLLNAQPKITKDLREEIERFVCAL